MKGKRYFDEVASRWDKMRGEFFSEGVREKAISVANVQPGKVAADIGAGTGFITEELIKRGLKVIAIDQSEEMIREMKKRFNRKGLIDYRIGDAQNIPIEQEHVDYVFANMFLHHVESPADAIKEMARILKSSGTLVITDLDEHDFEFLKTEHYDRWKGFKREDIRYWFIESGLKEIKIDCVGENCCARSDRGNKYARINIFVASGVKHGAT
jgi:ubiquinone/menaquinone biosynthesis C-methylase UbiE